MLKSINTRTPARFIIRVLRTQSRSVSQICSPSLTSEMSNTCLFAKWLMLTLMGSVGVVGESDCRHFAVDNQAVAAAMPGRRDFGQSFET